MARSSTTFKKGHGGKGGRPRTAAELREGLSKKTQQDLDAIRKIAETAKAEKVRLQARIWLAEQIVGKAPQAITGKDGGPVQVDLGVLDMLRRLAVP